jgi:Family of unknown function (DUF5694)
MKNLFFCLVLFLTSFSLFAQNKPQDNVQKGVAGLRVLYQTKEVKPKIYLFGVFHFAGEKVDSNTTPDKWAYNASDAKRQKEIEAVRLKLMNVKPSVICVEAGFGYQKIIDSLYSGYCKGLNVSNSRYYDANDETLLFAFEIGKRLGLKSIRAVDASPMQTLKDDKIYEAYQKFAPTEGNDTLYNKWDIVYEKAARYSDSLLHHWTTLDYLRYLNSDDYYTKVLGRWLITTRHGNNSNPIGADQFITRYYNRNIRIFANIQRAISNENDRVLVIYGNTHMSILRQLFSASPMYELVSPSSFLK